jgi:tol-pal system protein YbgF
MEDSMKKISMCVGFLFFLGGGSLYAEAPVVDATPSGIYVNQPTMPVASPTVSNRVASVEQQLNAKITHLQQTNQDLTNLVTMQSKQITALKVKCAAPVVHHRIKRQAVEQKVVSNEPVKKTMLPVAHMAPVNSKPAQFAPAMPAPAPSSSSASSAPQPKMVVLNNSKPTTKPKPKQAVASTSAATDDSYAKVYALVKAQKYSDAIPALQAYVSANPTGKNAGDAYYWLGQLQAIAGKTDEATAAYTTLVNHYPQAKHVPDAMLQLAAFAKEKQQWVQTQQWLQKITIAYPNSAAARLAKVRLQQLQQAGH